MLKPFQDYGFAHPDAVDDAIAVRVQSIGSHEITEVALLLGEALVALADINQSIPVFSNQRHLVAGALEKFANGSQS